MAGDRIDKLYNALKADGTSVPSRDIFRRNMLAPGKTGYNNRLQFFKAMKADGADVGNTYEDFAKSLGLHAVGNPTVNKYRQQMFNSVDPTKNKASELTRKAVKTAHKAMDNVRKPVRGAVVNKQGKKVDEFDITPAKTVEDLDREYAQEVTKNWENELHDQMADADKDAAKISDMFKSFIGSTDEVGSVWGNMTRGGGISGVPHSVTTNNGILENTEARQLLAASDYNRKRKELLQLEQDSRNGAIFDDHSFFRGMYDAAKDTGLLTGGASDLINAGSLLSTKQDLDNGIHTEAGDMLMQQAVKNSDAQSQYDDNKGWMYTGGVITTNMAPFMMQVASAGFSKGLSTSIGKVVQGAASKVALGTMKKAAGFASADLAKNIGKFTGLSTKAFGKAIQYGIVGAAQANTVGLGNVANDVINRYTGQVYQDEQGNYKFGTFDSDGKLVHEGGEDFLTALVKGEAAQTIEFATELAGGGIDAAGTALKNFVTKGGKKIINKYNMENVSKVIDFLLNNKVSKNARYLKAGADRTLGKVEVNSIIGESLEEELGIIANTVFTGDNKISDLWDEKQQSQIWGGMLLSIGLMKGAVAPFHAYNAKQYYSYKHKLNKADANLSQLLGNEKWEELRDQIDATTNKDMPDMINKINRDVALGKNRQPVREYIQNLIIMRGYDIGNMLAAKKAVEDKGEGVSVKNMEKNQAYQQGRDAYGYDTHEIQLDQEDKQKSLAQLLGISEQQLASMSDEELESFSGRDDNIDRAIYDYQLSSARYEGVVDNARDQIDLEVQRAAQAVDMYTDKSRNTIRNATIKASGGLEDYGVYIISGNIATHDDGSIDVSNSDDMILYYDPTTNTVEHADAMMFAELGSEENADEVRSQAMADAKEKAIKETTGIIDGVVEVGTQFKTTDADGTGHTYEVLADNGDGTAMITIDGNIPTELVKGENVQVPVSFEELQKMKDASDQQRLQAAKDQREQLEKERAEQQNQAQTTQAENPAQESNTQSAPIEDNLDYSDIIREDGKVQMVDVSDKDGNNLFPDAKDVFYIQGNKMRTKFAYIDANGELKTQGFPTGLVKIKTIGEVSVDDYKEYRNMILAAESSATPDTSMIEDNSGTIEADRGGIEVDDNTQPLSEADADNIIAQMESSAEVVPELELTPDNWSAEFGEDGIVSTPIGDVKMGENQVAKLFEKGRSKEFGMIKPTLTNPDVIIEVPSHSADGNEERSSSYLFIKTFLGKNGKKVYYFKSVTIKKDGLEISISSHYDRAKRVKEALMKGKLLYRKNDGAQTEQNQPSTSVTTSQEDAAGSSENKDTNISANGNENNESLTFEDGTPIPVDENGETDLSQTDAAHAAEWYDNNLGEDADDWLDGEIKKAKKVLEQAQNKKVTGTKPSELVASKKEKETAIADAQAHYDSAISIRDALKERQLAKVEDTADGRKELIDKARRKFARLKSAVKNDAEAVAQLYKETVGSLLHRLYDGTGIDVTDTTPLTAEEYVAANVAPYSLNYEGNENSKGVQQETGLSRSDFAKLGWLAKDGKGTTIDAMVHHLWDNRPSNLENADTQEIRNALLGLITSGQTAFESRNYIQNQRIDQAEKALEEQQRQEENAAYAEQQRTENTNEKINENTNEQEDAPEVAEQTKLPDKLKEGSEAIEAPEDATDENPLGLQLSKDKVPFKIEGGKSGETYDINDKEDRKRLVAENSVDDKDILDIDMPKHVHKAIKELCKKMGLKVQFLYMGARLNGWIENGTMYLALDTEKATQFVFGHEMTHAIKQKNPEAYKELAKVAMVVTTRKKFEEDLAKVYRIYHNASGYNNIDDFVEEVIADNIGKFINDHDLAQRFVLRLNHPVLATILHAIQKIKSLLYGDFYKSVDALERIVEKAYVDTAKGEVTNSETGEDVSFSLRLKSAIDETETNPSDAQKESGNYKKGHIKFGGYDYTIENPKGSTRSGKDADGKEWKITMHDTYGYIRGKFGKDGDHLDMFINDKADLDNWNGDVFVVDQVNPDGSFDEHKVMYGYDSMDDAEKAYLANYSKGWKGLGNITGASKAEFDKWLDTSNRKLKPFADYAKVKFSQAQSVAEPRQSLDDIKPVSVGAFGNIYNQFRGKAKAAIEFLKKLGSGEATAALHHHTIGDISLVWGDKKTGLDKILRKHPEVVDNLQSIIDSMEVVRESDNRIKLESPTHFAVVSKEYKGEPREQWLLTAYEKRESLENGKSMDTATSSLGGDTALSQSKGSAAKIDNSSETSKENGEKVENEGTKFSLKDEKTMFGMHNISVDKLRKAIKQGGFAAPSMGVVDSKNGIYSGYGEITLIPKAEKIAKRTGKNIGTYAADAWTPIYPPVEKKFGGNGGDVAYDDIESVPKEMQSLTRNAINSFMDGRDTNSLAYLYLHEKGKAPDLVHVEGKYPKELHDEVKGILGKLDSIYSTTDEQKEKLLDLFIREVYDGNREEFDNDIKNFIKKDEEFIKKRPNSNIAKNKQLDVDWMKEHGYDYGALSRFVDGILRDAETSGKVDENATMKAAQQYIQDNGMKEDFDSWKEKLNDRYQVEEVIFAGYKDDGNRKYLPNTVENAVKVMKQDGKNASVGSASFSHFVASILKPMGTLDQIRKKKGNLTGNYEDVEKFQEKWQPVYDELADKMQPDAEPFESYGMDRLEEAATQKNPKKYAKDEYGVDLTDEDIDKLNELIDAVKNEKPSIYFETKFMRPYGLDEFEKAIVPNDTPSDVVDALKKAGIDVSSYERGNAEDRQKVTMDAINSSDNIRFSLKSMMEKPEGWKQANKKTIHIAEAIERDPKFSLKKLDGTLIKAGTYFSGGGLVEEGLKGIIDPVIAVEYDEKISGVYRNNFGQHIVTADVRDVDPKELVKQIDGEVEYFHASPVCKNYSQAKSNHAEVELDKETAASTAEFINAIKPKVVTIENVKGYKDSDAMKTITDALDANGYTWDADVYNAADYGGYTNRERLIVRAVRDGKLPEKPKKMARKSGWYEAVADIIPTLTEKKNGVAPWMDIRLKADGIDWRNIDKPLYVMGSAYADGKVPHAFADELLPTLRTKSGDVIVMPDGKVYRAMGRVLARVSGVSDDYKMPFSESLSHTIIGNGIPTQLTEHVIAPLLTGSDPKFSLKKTNNVKDSRIIPTDVDKSVSSQIENKYDSAIKEVMNKVTERDKKLVSNYIEQDLSDFSKMRREDINQELKSNENWRRKNLREENREGSAYGITDARHRITEATAERELEYRDVRAKYLSETYGLQGGRKTSLDMVDRAFEETLGNETSRGELRELYGKARKILVQVGADFGGVANAKQEGDLGFAGTDRNISLFIDTMTRTSTPQSELAHTILHEMIHQATIGAINLVKKGMADGMLTPKQIEATNTIINTYDAYKADRRLVWEEDNYRDYGGKDEYEFAAEMADAKQRRILSIPYGDRILNAANELKKIGDVSLWQAIKNALRRLFEVSDKSKMDKALSDIMDDFNKNIDDISLNNIEQTDFGLNGNTRFSLRYDQFEHDLNQWKKDNNLPKNAQRPTIPQRNAGESAVDFLKRVDEYRKQMALWKTAPTYEQHLLSDDTALGEFNRELQRGSVLKRIAFQDSMLAIRKAQEAIMKEVGVDRLNMAEDAYTAENRSHGKGKNEFEEYNNEFLQPLRKAYHQMKKVLGDSYDNVRIYMMAKHGLERDAQMAFKKSLEADFEDVAQRSAAYKAYKGDMNRIINDSDLEFGRVDFTTWRQRDNALRAKYSPSYMDYRYDKMGIANDYSGLSALFGGSDFEEAAHKLVRDIESKHVAEVQDLWNATNAATKKILRDGYKAGMMSKDTYKYVRDMYSHYIPLRGWDGTTADQVWDYIGGGKGAFNQTLKKAHGRTSIADDPIAYIENMAESGILLNNKNWVKQHLMLLAQNHPTSLLTLSKAWYVKSVDDNGNEEWIPATPQITSQMNSNQVKAAIDAFEKKMEQMAQTGDATQKRDGLNIAYPQTHSEEREHEVRVMKDGEEYVIYVNGDPQLAQAMNNTRAHRVREIQSGKLDRAAAWLGRKMAAAYTSLSPLFIPSNYFRDLTMTLASTAIREDGRYNYLLRKNLATSWNLGFILRDYQSGKLREKVSNGNATAKEQMFYDFMMNGGETGFVSSLDVEDLKKKFKNDLKDLDRWKANPVKVGHTIMDGIEFLNRAIEDSNRFAIYMTSIQYGRSIDEAVNDAKDVTLNFNRKGTGEYGWQMVRNLYLFINPAVQSLQTLGALAKHHPFKFTAVTASWLASGVLVPIVNAALMNLLGGDDDKDKYWQFTKWDRRNNLIMWVPFTHEYVKIPLAQEFRAFYGIGDMIASKMMGGELAEESWSQYAEDLLGQVVDMLPLDPTGYDGNIVVSLMPNPIRPVFELAFNVDFTGKPLFKDSEYNKYDPNFTKAYVGTPDWLVRASKMINSIGNDYPDVQQNAIDAFGDPRYNLNNPAVVDHILSSYLGGAYTMGSQVLGVLTKALNDPKEIKMADIPLLSKFVSNPDDRPVTKKQGDEFWNMKENHDRAANTLSKLKKQAKVDGDYSMLERFYDSEEYKQYKQDDVKVKKYEEDKKKERAEESGEEYRPHKLNAEDIYKAHATPKDDFEDLKLKQLYTKLNGFKTSYDLLVDTAPNQSEGYYNTNKAAIDAIDEISLDKQEISELKKGFLDDGKDAYNAEDMKQIRELRKKILSVLEKANKVVVANQKAKAKKK